MCMKYALKPLTCDALEIKFCESLSKERCHILIYTTSAAVIHYLYHIEVNSIYKSTVISFLELNEIFYIDVIEYAALHNIPLASKLSQSDLQDVVTKIRESVNLPKPMYILDISI